MDDTAHLALSIVRDRIRRARKQTVEQKLIAGGELFDQMCERMIRDIRGELPDFDDEQVLQELRRRLEIARHLENRPKTSCGSEQT